MADEEPLFGEQYRCCVCDNSANGNRQHVPGAVWCCDSCAWAFLHRAKDELKLDSGNEMADTARVVTRARMLYQRTLLDGRSHRAVPKEDVTAKIVPLTEQQIAEARANAVEAQRDAPCLTGAFLVFICDSHEALRAEVDRLTRERDKALEGGRVIGRTLQHQIGVGRAEYERANRVAREVREALDEINRLRAFLAEPAEAEVPGEQSLKGGKR